jgi:hypothetical protein
LNTSTTASGGSISTDTIGSLPVSPPLLLPEVSVVVVLAAVVPSLAETAPLLPVEASVLWPPVLVPAVVVPVAVGSVTVVGSAVESLALPVPLGPLLVGSVGDEAWVVPVAVPVADSLPPWVPLADSLSVPGPVPSPPQASAHDSGTNNNIRDFMISTLRRNHTPRDGATLSGRHAPA